MGTILYIVGFALLAASASANRCVNEADGTILPSRECQFYVICQGGSEHQVRCQPMGTFFDVRRMECDRRPNVLCWDGVSIVTTTTVSTPAEETTIGETTEMPEETTEAKETTEATTSAPPNFAQMCRGIVIDLLEHPNDCSKFILCVMGRYSVEQCGEHQIFYPQVRICGYGNPDEC